MLALLERRGSLRSRCCESLLKGSLLSSMSMELSLPPLTESELRTSVGVGAAEEGPALVGLELVVLDDVVPHLAVVDVHHPKSPTVYCTSVGRLPSDASLLIPLIRSRDMIEDRLLRSPFCCSSSSYLRLDCRFPDCPSLNYSSIHNIIHH